MKGFSIIIVTWNALEHLKKFLPSVVQTDYPDYEIIIADNASTDGSTEWVRSEFPGVKIASLNKNYGYCGGNNKAVPFASKEILLFLNNDVKVDPGWLHGINNAFEQDDRVAAVQPKMRSFEDPEFFEYAGAAGGFMDKFGYTFCRGRIFEAVEKDEGQYDEPADIFWASGAALAIRKDLFLESGGFDEDFEFHMEEIDLCWRLQNQGYIIRYTPDSLVYHLGGGSLPMGSTRKVYYNFRNSLAMLWKNYSDSSLRSRFFIRLMLDVAAASRALLFLKPGEFIAIARAHIHFFGNLDQTTRKRERLQQKRKIEHDPETMLDLNLVTSYFFKRKKKFMELEPDRD